MKIGGALGNVGPQGHEWEESAVALVTGAFLFVHFASEFPRGVAWWRLFPSDAAKRAREPAFRYRYLPRPIELVAAGPRREVWHVHGLF